MMSGIPPVFDARSSSASADILAPEHDAAVFEARVEAHHPVIHVVHRDSRADQIGHEHAAAIGQTDPRCPVPGWLCFSSRLLRPVAADPGRDLLVVVVVAERFQRPNSPVAGNQTSMKDCVFNLLSSARRSRPACSGCSRTSRCISALCGVALQPEAGRGRPAEELVGDQPVVDAKPVRKLSFGTPHGRQRGDAAAHSHKPLKLVAEVSGADDLRRIALRRV